MLRIIRIEEGLGRLSKDAKELKNTYMSEYICEIINKLYQEICNNDEENKGE